MVLANRHWLRNIRKLLKLSIADPKLSKKGFKLITAIA
jgi:hypothetical protein